MIEGDEYFSIADTDDLENDSVVLYWGEQADSAKEYFVLH
jgi:hypothetical protein